MRPNIVRRRLLEAYLLAFLALLPPMSWSADLPQMSPTQSKEFTLISHYHYIERAYTPPQVISRVQEDPRVPPNFAEEELISQISAIDLLDFDWWLNTWDGPSQQKIQERMTAEKTTDKDWKAQWSPKAGKMRVSLTRWLLTGEYVILVYTISPEESMPAPPAKQKQQATVVSEVATAFHLWNGRWHATLDLEADPVMLHFTDSKSEFERVIRP